MNELSLFSGAGGGLLASKYLLGWKTIGYVEWEEYPQKVIAQRIKDGHLDLAPIYGDIRTFSNSGCADLYKGITDVISGGFPCTDISCAGKGAGIEGQDSGYWKEMAKTICDVKPRRVFVENSTMLTIRGLGTVLSDLSKMGFDAEWCCLSSANTGGFTKRDRIWIMAYANDEPGHETNKAVNTIRIKRKAWRNDLWKSWRKVSRSDWEVFKPEIPSEAYEMATRVDESKAIGNGQDPIVAATAWNILTGGI